MKEEFKPRQRVEVIEQRKGPYYPAPGEKGTVLNVWEDATLYVRWDTFRFYEGRDPDCWFIESKYVKRIFS